VRFSVCPSCGARYPTFHSPEGSSETLCDSCGWCSDPEQLMKDLEMMGAKRTARGQDGR